MLDATNAVLEQRRLLEAFVHALVITHADDAAAAAERARLDGLGATAVEEAFSSYSPQLRNLARRAFDERWVDDGPRAGKRGGAFCMPVRGTESRVLVNFSGSWDAASTLAHELGHAYNNTDLASRPALARRRPGGDLRRRSRPDADAFRSDYDDLLASTGPAPAAELAGRFDIDTTDQAFWTSSLDVVRARIEEPVGLPSGHMLAAAR